VGGVSLQRCAGVTNADADTFMTSAKISQQQQQLQQQ